ncbi:MAG: hypothetical protein QOI95_818 [Acidimicrobiaceae bacterium]
MITQWEYVKLNAGTNMPLGDFLTRLGAEGWEVVTMAFADKTIGLNQVMIVAKRECESPSPPTELEPEWHDDPTGRFDKRYWDGRGWSAHVGTVGPPKTTAIDPPTMLPPTEL